LFDLADAIITLRSLIRRAHPPMGQPPHPPPMKITYLCE
jgi:hypothetical protein